MYVPYTNRRFAHGVNVSYNIKTGQGKVAGWTFAPPPAPPPLPPTPPAPACCVAETGCLYSGGNIATPKTPLASVADCCASCGAEHACRFWSFSVASRMCRLHSASATKHKDGPGTPVRVCGKGCKSVAAGSTGHP